MIILARLLNLRYLSGRKLRTALTVAGIASGVALVFSIAVINTTLIESFRQGLRVVAGEAELEVASAGPAGLRSDVQRDIEAVDGVERAVPVLRSTTSIASDGSTEEIVVLGVTPEFLGLFPSGGALGGVSIEGGIVGGLAIAAEVSDRLGVQVGDGVVVSTPQGLKPSRVTGVLSGGPLRAVNAGAIAVMALGDAQELFDRPGKVDSFYVVVAPDADTGDVTGSLEEEFGSLAVVGPPGERGRGLERVFGGIGTLLSLTGTVSLFVALFVVFNTMSMAVAERRRDLSMALAVGASPRLLFRSFVAEAALLGTLASITGLIFGRLLAEVLVDIAASGYRILPISAGGAVLVRPPHLAGSFAGGLVVSIIGAIIPARRVLRMAPVEALRPIAAYESQVSIWSGTRFATAGVAGMLVSLPLMWLYIVTNIPWLATLGLVIGLAGVTLLLPVVVPFGLKVVRRITSPFIGTEGRLAADTLERNPGRTTFTTAALVLTLGLVLGVAGALSSYNKRVADTAGALIGAPLYVVADSFAGLSSDQPLPVSLRGELARVEGVSLAYPIRFAYVNVGEEQAVLYGIPGREALDLGMTTQIEAITDDKEVFTAGLERGGIAISDLMADRRDLEVGDEVTLPIATGERDFEVVATFEDLVSFDSIYIDHDVYMEAWEDDKADEFGILLEAGADEAAVRRGLEAVIASEAAPAHVMNKDEIIGQLLDLVEGTFSLGRAIQFAALIVALLTIANTMFTSVLERKWEHGLQRALGMSNSQLSREVVIESALLGIVGAAGGVLVGTALGWLITQAMEVKYDWHIGFHVPYGSALWVTVIGVLVAAIAGFLPSRLAVRPTIVESLRFE